MADLSKLPQLLAKQDWPKAEALLRRAAKGKVVTADVYYNLAKVLEAGGKAQHMEVWLRRAVKARPDYVVAWFELGRLALDREDFADSAVAFRKAVAHDPQDGDARLNLARVLLRLGKWHEARDALSGLSGDEVDLMQYRIAAELGEDLRDLRGELLARPDLRPLVLRAMTRVAKGNLILNLT